MYIFILVFRQFGVVFDSLLFASSLLVLLSALRYFQLLIHIISLLSMLLPAVSTFPSVPLSFVLLYIDPLYSTFTSLVLSCHKLTSHPTGMGIYMVHGAWNGEPTLSCPRDGRNYFVETCTDNPGQRSAPRPAFSSSSTPVSQSSYPDSDSESYPTTESTTTTSTNEDDGEVEQSTWVKPAWNSLWGPVADWTTWAPDALYSFPVPGWPVRKPIGPKTGDGAPVEDPARIAIEGQEQGQEWPVEYGPGPVVPGPGSAKWEGVAPASPPTAPQSPEGQEQVQEFKEDSAPAYAPAPIIPADRWTDAAPRNYLLPSPSPSSPSPSPKSSDWKPSSRLGSSSSIQDVGAESMQARNLPSIPVKPSAGYGRF